MNRAAEAALLAGAAVIAAFGVTTVNLARGGGWDAQVALTLLVFLISFGGVHLAVRQWARAANPYLLPLAALLAAVAMAEIYRLDPRLASFQRWWLVIGATGAIAILWLLRLPGTSVLRRYRYLFLLGALALFLLPLLPSSWPLGGVEVNGSRLWVRLTVLDRRVVQFQPGELGKLLLVGFLASYLAERQSVIATMTRRLGPLRLPEPRQLAPVVAAWAVSLIVLVYQRDLGASLLLLAIFVTMLYAASGRAVYLLTGAGLFAAGAAMAVTFFDHAQRRIDAWLIPWSDYTGSGFQIAQSLFAMGSGSLSGSGLGLGQPDLIPSAATDFIFSAVAEETGLAGAMAIVAAYVLLIAAGFGIALRARDPFRKLLAAGLTLTISLQVVLIVGGTLRMFPLTGIALPFMSYGGSSLVANMMAVAVLARLSDEEPA